MLALVDFEAGDAAAGAALQERAESQVGRATTEFDDLVARHRHQREQDVELSSTRTGIGRSRFISEPGQEGAVGAWSADVWPLPSVGGVVGCRDRRAGR